MHARSFVYGLVCLALTTLSAQSQTAPAIHIRYEEPKAVELKAVYLQMQKQQALEKLRDIFGIIRLPNGITIRATQCNDLNAYYDPEKEQVVLCYELIAAIQKLAPQKTTQMGVTPEDAVTGPILFFALHEMAHGVFEQLRIPVLGNVENAADQVAFFALLQFSPDEAKRVIGGAAYFINRLAEFEQITRDTIANIHALSSQRFYALLCIAYGADAERFENVVSKDLLTKDRAEFCRLEYRQVAHAVRTLIGPHIDANLRDHVVARKWLQPATQPAFPAKR